MQPLRISPEEAALRRPHVAPAVKRDPAPSRAAYRFHRMWLSPVYRAVFRVGIPTFVAITALGWYFSDPANREAVVGTVTEMRRAVETRPEFMVKLMAVEGATPVVDTAIRQLLAVEFPVSSFDLDLAELQAEMVALDAIETADLHIRPGGVLEVRVVERQPALVWRTPASVELIDATGHRVATLTARAARPDLPLVAGEGADRAAPEALALIAAARPIADRLRGLVRVGERRWDVVLADDKTILLPETNPVAALDQVLALDQAQDLLGRDVTHIDMRNPQRPTLRLSAAAVEGLREIKSLSAERQP